jgi:hypothetical protein
MDKEEFMAGSMSAKATGNPSRSASLNPDERASLTLRPLPLGPSQYNSSKGA